MENKTERPRIDDWTTKAFFRVDGKCTATPDQREGCAGYEFSVVFPENRCMYFQLGKCERRDGVKI